MVPSQLSYVQMSSEEERDIENDAGKVLEYTTPSARSARREERLTVFPG